MSADPPAFAADPATAAYYQSRADEYDDWYTGAGLFADRDRPGWDDEVAAIVALTDALPPRRTLDVACGTGFLTRHLHGYTVGIDQSPRMVAIAQARIPKGLALVADALALPFADHAFERVFTGHFYGHLPPEERDRFLTEVRRVATSELIVVDSAPRPGVPAERWDERTLNDGSRHRVFKRFLSGDAIAAEIGGEPRFNGRWFSAAAAPI